MTLDPREQRAQRTCAVLPLKPSTGLPQDACEASFLELVPLSAMIIFALDAACISARSSNHGIL